MNQVLLIGNSAIEDTLSFKLNNDSSIENIFICPGNGGSFTKKKSINIELNLKSRKEIEQFLSKNRILYVLNSSYNKMTEELYEVCKQKNIPIIGISYDKIKFFNSRILIREFLKKYNIPSFEYEIIDSLKSLKEYSKNLISKKILHTDYQKGFKGIYVLESRGQAMKLIDILKPGLKEDSRFIIEPYNKYEEYTAIIAYDTSSYLLFPVLRSYPKAFDNDYGLYTSGMGAFAPLNSFTDEDIKFLKEKIIEPVLSGLNTEKYTYSGFLTFHILKHANEIKCLTLTPSFTSPEIETISTLVSASFNELFLSLINKKIKEYNLLLNDMYSVSVVLASKGYPLDVQKGILIAGIEKAFENIEIFHNKTLMIFYSKYRGYITNGGRILTINCTSESLENSRKLIYNILDRGEIFFDGNFYRTDIAEKYCNLKTKQSIEAD